MCRGRVAVVLVLVIGTGAAAISAARRHEGIRMTQHDSDPRHAFMPPGAAGPGREEAATPPYTPGDASNSSSSPVENVRRQHERTLMAIDGVTGVAVGRAPTGDDAIVVYVRHAAAGKAVPATLDGHPVVVRVTGEIDAYGRPRAGGEPRR